MKTEILASLDALRAQIVSLLPDDPLPVPATPTGLSVIRTYGTNPLMIELGWDEVEGGCASLLQYKEAEGSNGGPQEWTDIPNGSPNETGVRATLVLANPDGQNSLIRLAAMRWQDGQYSEHIQITFP